jgi:hypothetical protein
MVIALTFNIYRSGTGLIVGYFVGKFGLFGIPKEVPPTPGKQAMNIVTCLKNINIYR